MIVYPILSTIVFGLWRRVAKAGSWITTVQADSNWKQHPPLQGKVIWMHCASLGEFEMGRPVLEQFLDTHQQWQAVVTFFSPSGYEPRKSYNRATVHYLPIDTPKEVKKWLSYCNPSLAVFVRYDLWPNHINGLRRHRIPTVVMAMSATKSPWYLGRTLPLMRSIFRKAVTTWGVVSDSDAVAMSLAGIHSEVLGNPKYDYAAGLVGRDVSEKFLSWKKAQNKPVLLVGSAHVSDCDALQGANLANFSVWVVPHEINETKMLGTRLEQHLTGQLHDSTIDEPKATDVLMVPEFGILSGLYSLADAVLIGGGWDKSTHNVLEATAQGKVVACGPNWQRIAENHDLVKDGFLYPIESSVHWNNYLSRVGTAGFIQQGMNAQAWMLKQRGASKKIVKVLEEAVQL